MSIYKSYFTKYCLDALKEMYLDSVYPEGKSSDYEMSFREWFALMFGSEIFYANDEFWAELTLGQGEMIRELAIAYQKKVLKEWQTSTSKPGH